MKNKLQWTIFTILLPVIGSFFPKDKELSTLTIPFYSEQLSYSFDPDLVIAAPKTMEEQEIVAFYRNLEETSYESLISTLKKHQSKYNLNDWLVYELTKKIVDHIYTGKSDKQKNLTTWFLLSKLGYDTRLAFLKNQAFIYVRTEEEIFETPLIEDENHRFVGLSEMQQKRSKSSKGVYLLNFLAAPNGKSFSFSLKELPALKIGQQNKTFQFTWNGETFQLPIQIDKTLIDVMDNYPVIAESGYLSTPMSNTLKNSLLPHLRDIIKDKTQKEKLEILVTFTRSAFKYREDEDYFGRSRPMIPDEVFFYPYSDCEDRSAVFFSLVEELLGLPMIVVAFPDHLTIAVGLDEPIGPSIKYKGKKFYICDPTGPSNSSEIGRVPKGYERQSFEILMDNFDE